MNREVDKRKLSGAIKDILRGPDEADRTPPSEKPKEVLLLDMPDSVLFGRLGEIYQRRLSRFPIAYGYTALVTAASALVPRDGHESKRFNLYSALVGQWHSGKSQAIGQAQKLLGITPLQLLDVMAGSAEGLIRKCKDAAGNPRLFSPDELGHLLSKAAIQNASFAYILNRAFYADKFEVLMGRGKAATFHVSLSILGGVVEDKFQDLFSAATTGGLYDRFVYGACPGGFTYDYEPFDEIIEPTDPICPTIDREVWVMKSEWRSEDPGLEPRVAELAIRFACVCAAFDGRQRLTAADLGPAREFARYQTRIRQLLKPNAGENFEARVALKILDYLEGRKGQWVSKRTMLREIHAYRLGPSIAERALCVLLANGDIEFQKNGREQFVRIALEP